MHPLFRNILALLAGLLVGSLVNMGLIHLGNAFMPGITDMDMNDPASINARMALFGPEHFIMPFLAHALGTLAGAWVAARAVATHHMALALTIGALFLVGGILAVVMIPAAPVWFKVLDLVVAYLPMAWAGGRMGRKLRI
ncbi:MAG: hypothetical protein ACOH13_11140 [Flavobacteriales bacterium]